jgi:hypothetical protein
LKILAIDQSTSKVGWAIFHNSKLKDYGLIELEKLIKDDERFENKDYIDRIALLKEIILAMVKKNKIDIVGFEDIIMTSFGGRANATQVDVFKKLAKALGVLEVGMIDNGIYYITTPAGVWRKGLKLGTKREEIKANTIDYVNEKFKLELRPYQPKKKDNDDDIADAIGLGSYISKLDIKFSS